MASVKNTVSFEAGPDPATLIQTERAASKFNPKKMNYFLEGSVERAEEIASLQSQMERDPILASTPAYYDLTKDEQRELTAKKISRIARYLESNSFEQFEQRLSLIGVFDPQVGTRVGVNLGLFLSCIRGNGTFQQLEYWALHKEACYLKNIYGCFGMTELAHGSNVMALETTATFDEETDEFIINTPHIGATKWWIGGAAHSATHCTVYARLIVKGEDYGVKTFVVPLRDSQFNLCPGVTVGDIGAKMGRDGIDNGWIQFANVRIPRFFMLQKFAKVSREGEVTLPPLEQLAYTALLGGRVMMVLDSYRMMARMSTIALRYAIGRRQFHKNGMLDSDEGAQEIQIIDYALHQRRLFPYLAAAYVASAGALKVERTIKDTLALIDDAVDNEDDEKLMEGIEKMKSLFIDSGALKSNLTWMAAQCIDECRQSCGGHGYSAYNGFGKAYNDWVVQCTWEGDNNILGVFVGKPIAKHVVGIINDDKVVQGSAAFLNDVKDYVEDKGDKYILESVADVQDLTKVKRALEVAIMRSAYSVHKQLEKNDGDFDACGADLVQITRLKAHHYLLDEFTRRVAEHDDKELVPYLNTLGKYYFAGLVLQQCATYLLSFNIISSKTFAEVNGELLPALGKEIRPNVVAYTDSFQMSDMLINSAIGRYDGNIYENYYSTVKQLNPPSNDKAPYTQVLVDMLSRGSLEQRDRYEKSFDAAEILSS
ncbi:acyl-coenzyme A oxidase 2 [Diutina catenulata]